MGVINRSTGDLGALESYANKGRREGAKSISWSSLATPRQLPQCLPSPATVAAAHEV